MTIGNYEKGWSLHLWCGVDVPEADGVIVAGGEEVAVEVGVPGQPVTFLLVTTELQVRLAFT